ncbi:beta strand repeat-containing protein [Rubinisphaera sp. JC750]|uniref:beta strand repeat-containing protein n=1 Tax=Rubinisphaera sp. JC750 TaxID=2898658 RepID=UPI001F21E7DD|nr:hypothetical protein [Rubinisphaera sp. JC750]
MMNRECSPTWTLCLFSTLLFALMAVFQAGTVSAQSNRYAGQAFEPLTNTYFFLQYEGGDDWAQGTQQTQFGGTRYVDALNGNGLWLNYGQFGFDHNGHHSLNAGVVRRFWLGGGIVGLGGHYDLTRSNLGNDFQKAAVTAEWFSSDSNWIVRGEGNFAVGPDSFLIQDLGTTVDELFFQGNNLMIGQSAGQLREEGMSGLEYELARSLGNYAAEGYLGGYHYLGQIGDDANGIKGGVRGFVSPGVFANLEVREDNVFGTSLYGGVTLFLGGPARNQRHTLADQLIMPVQRHDQAIVNTVDTRVLLPDVAVTQGGNAITFTHIDNVNTGGDGNSGTFEDPFTSLVAANGSTSDIVYVHSGTTFNGQSYTMAENQRFLGEGGGNQHQLMTDQFGLINLPDVNGIAGARPVIQNGTNLITAAGNSEISNFNLLQTNRAIYFNNVNGVVDVNRLMTDAAIEVNGGSGDFTFSDVHIDSSFTDGLRINGGSANVTFSGIYGGSSIAVSDGYAVVVQGSHSGTVLFPTDSVITATDTEGFLFLGGLSGNYIFNSTNTISNDSDGGIQLANSGGTYVFGENTSITNTGDGAVLLNLSGVNDIDFTYSGTIRNFNNESINITGGPAAGQSIVFNSTAEDAIQDSADGISISGTDANVTVSAETELTGSGGIYVGVSGGTYTFTDTDVNLSSGTDAAMRIDGGSSTVNFVDDSLIINTTLDRTAILVDNGHTGTLNMEGDVGASAGDGLVFDNADGTYNFTGTTVLNGSTRGIDVGNGSSGTFAFSDTTAIANTTDEAIRMDLANADNLDFTYSGLVRNSTGRAIDISGGPGTGQSVLFDSTEEDAILDGGEGIRIANTDADVNIQADTELTGSNGVEINNSNGTYTFADTDINLSSGANPSLSISGGSSDVNFGADSSITNDQNRSVVNVLDGHTGTLTMDGNISSTAGNGIVFDNADGTYNFNGTTNLNGTTRGIYVFNGSSGTFGFSENTSIANVTGSAVDLNLANADNLDFTYSGTIQNSTGTAISVTGNPGTGQSVLFNSTVADAIQDSGNGISIYNTAADVNIQSDVELTGSRGVMITDSTGTYTFADTDINLSSGLLPALSIDGGSSTVNFGANSSITNDQNRIALLVQGGHTGTLNMDGNISSTAGDGIVFNNADGAYNFNGTTALDGTNRGIYVINSSSGTFAFSEDTSIANTVDSAVELSLANAENLDFTYSGTIQNSTGMAIGVFGGPSTGQSVLFNSTAADAIQDSGEGIVIANTNADVNIQSDTELTGTGGVTVRESTGTYTFADTDIKQGSAGNPALWIDGGSSTVNFGTDSSITHDQLHDVVRVENVHTGTLNMDGAISATAGNGILFDNADGTYNFNGTTNLNGTARGIDVANGSAGTFTFSEDTSIANTGNEAIRINTATADNLDFTYSGTIQNSTDRAISITGGPGSGQSVLFNSTAADAIQDSGEGIQIASTDADVNIQSDTELTGSNGVEITGSTGTYTFADTDINLGAGTSPSLLVNGGSVTINFGTNSSITNNSNRRVVDVAGHTGTLNMDGTISSTAGGGIIFNNADGTYNFNGTTNLNGTSNGIQITNGSSGTFTFSADTSITDTTSGTYTESDSTANVTYNGTITQNNNVNAVKITDKTGGTTTFNGLVTANTGTATAVELSDNAGSTTNFNGGLDIDTTTGTGLYASNAGNVNITGAGNSVSTNNGTGIHIADSTVDMIFSDITVLENSSGGDAINLRTMSGDFEVTGTTSIGSNGTVGNGINISSGTFDQTGTITFGEVFLGAAGTGGAGRAISVDGSGQTISFGDTTIAGGWGFGDIRYRSTGSTSSLTFDSLDNTAATAVRGLAIQNSAGSVTVNGGMIEGRGGAALDVDSGTGAITINSTIIDTSGGGNVVSISGRNGSSSAINLNEDVFGNGAAILVDNNTGGIINFNDGVVMTGDSGLYVDNNSGTTINFTGSNTFFDTTFTAIGFVNNDSTTALNFSGGNLDATSAFQIGLDANGPGTIAITGMNNSIGAFNDDAIDIDGIVFSLNNTWVNNAGAYYTIDTANSTLSGNGNIAPNFNSNNGGGNAGFIEFNGGLDLAP